MAGGGGGPSLPVTSSSPLGGGFGDNPLVPRKPMVDEARFDITAMIDLVFMMNIFFLVTTVTAALAEVNLPAAKHCAPADRDNSVIITLLAPPDRGPAIVVVEDSKADLTDVDAQERAIREAVEAGVRSNRNTVLIKAEKGVRLRDVSRVGAVAVSVPGTDLKLAVIEKE